MRTLPHLLVLGIAFGTYSNAQPTVGQISPRTIFYREQPDTDQLPAPTAVKASAPTKLTAATQATAPVPSNTAQPTTNAARPADVKLVSAVVPAVQHLGLRYNILLSTANNEVGDAADPDGVFHSGDCVAFQFEPNRSGYLYVFEQGSSGQWHLLFPSELLSDESNVVRSRVSLRVPAKSCFELNGPPGQERVFVVLSRSVEDLYALRDSMRSGPDSAPPAQVERASNQPVYTGENLLGAQIARLGMQRRDMALRKEAQPQQQGELPNTVYVVNAAQTPSDRVVTQITLQHR